MHIYCKKKKRERDSLGVHICTEARFSVSFMTLTDLDQVLYNPQDDRASFFCNPAFTVDKFVLQKPFILFLEFRSSWEANTLLFFAFFPA